MNCLISIAEAQRQRPAETQTAAGAVFTYDKPYSPAAPIVGYPTASFRIYGADLKGAGI